MSCRTRPPPRNPRVGCPCSAPPSQHGHDTVPAAWEAECHSPTTIPAQQQRCRTTGRRISTSTTQDEIGGATDVETGWQERCDYRREQRYWAGDRTTVCPRRGVRVYYRAPPERVGQGQSPDRRRRHHRRRRQYE